MVAPIRQQPMPWDWRIPAYDYNDPYGRDPNAPMPMSDADLVQRFGPQDVYGATDYMPPIPPGQEFGFGLPPAQFGPPQGGPQQQEPQGPLAEMDLLPPGPPEASPGFFEFLAQQPGALSDVALASAIFARSFTQPQEALQWAMQMQQQRESRQARAEQKQAEAESKKEAEKEKATATKQKQLYFKIDQARKDLANLGVDPGELPEEEVWPVYFEDLRGRLGQAQKAKQDEEKSLKQAEGSDKLKDQLRKAAARGQGSATSLYEQYKRRFGEDPLFKADLERNTSWFADSRARRQEMENLIYQEKQARRDLLKKLTPEQREMVNQYNIDVDSAAEKLDDFLKAKENVVELLKWGLSRGLENQDEIMEAAEAYEKELIQKYERAQKEAVDAAGGRKKEFTKPAEPGLGDAQKASQNKIREALGLPPLE